MIWAGTFLYHFTFGLQKASTPRFGIALSALHLTYPMLFFKIQKNETYKNRYAKSCPHSRLRAAYLVPLLPFVILQASKLIV